MADRVTLVLEKNRVHRMKVDRDDLISKSDYFASLLSLSFDDSENLEHRINYDIDVDTLRTFVKWVSDPAASVVGDRRHVKPSLAKYVKKSAVFDNVLKLLRLSVLFASESLIEDLTDLIACHYLVPEKSVQIWLLAKELGLRTLMELAKATCIDRLPELPKPSLLNLSGEDFIELAGNVHVKAKHLIPLLVGQWIEHNVPLGEPNPFESRYPFTFTSKDASDIEKMCEFKHWNHNMQCIVGQKQTPENGVVKCIYCWDGVTFSELMELSSSPIPFVEYINGMKAVARGFDIYLVGGIYGRRSKIRHSEIWRYSMISKTWYYVTSIPRPRHHMAVIFVEEDLYLIGGVEKFPHRRSFVNVYNVHTGRWRKLRIIREYFTDKALIFKLHDSVMLYSYPSMYWHLTDENRWPSRGGWFHSIKADGKWDSLTPRFLMTHGDDVYVLGSTERNRKPRQIFWLETFEYFPAHFIGECLTTFENQVSNGPYLTGFSHKQEKMCVEVMIIYGNKSLETKIVYEEDRSDIKDLCLNDPIGCFNVVDPKSLNKVCVFEDEAK